MPRYFTLSEAESLLPKVETAMREALTLYASQQEFETKLQEELQRISMLGGAMVNRGEISDLRNRRDLAASELNETIQRIHSIGCQIKDLTTGLVDFPTRYRGNEVLLCWRFGEKGIRFWHGLEEGFQGRKAIDQDFLDNHRGDHLN